MCPERRGKESPVVWNCLFGIKGKYQRYIRHALPRVSRSFERIGEIVTENLAARKRDREGGREREGGGRALSRAYVFCLFFSYLPSRITHAWDDVVVKPA